MIHVEKKSVKEGACNFCDRGELADSKDRIIYPYDTVWTMIRDTGSGLCARICGECLKKLKEQTKEQ